MPEKKRIKRGKDKRDRDEAIERDEDRYEGRGRKSERVLLVGAGIGNIRRNNVKRRRYREEKRNWEI